MMAHLTLNEDLKIAFDLLDGGILVLDGHLQIHYKNAWLQEKLPPALREAQTFQDLYGEHDDTTVLEILQDVLENQFTRILSPIFHAWIIPLPSEQFEDGHMRQRVVLKPITLQQLHQEPLLGVMIQLRDVSSLLVQVDKLKHALAAQKRLETQLKYAKEQAESANQAKSQFLANMSHEIRTPLNSLLPLSQYLAENQGGSLAPKDYECAQAIHEASQELALLIGDLLDLAQIEAGKIRLYPEDLSLRAIADYVQRTFYKKAAEKSLLLVTEVHPDAPDTIVSDRHKINQILKNLLSNALKFTHAGKVCLSIRPVTLEERREHAIDNDLKIAFVVSDTGIGISDEKQETVFMMFEQADGSTNRQYGGTGLGLAIVKNLAQALRGVVHLQSKNGHGSTFTLYLPLQILMETEAEEDRKEFPPRPVNPVAHDAELETLLPGKKILVVDDDMRNVFTLKAILEESGAQIVVAKNGKRCLECLEHHPDIGFVFMDIMMPEMDGFEAIKIIRQNPSWIDLPIVALTAKAMKEDKAKSFEVGATDYMAKPFDNEQLFSMLKKHLRA